jgi:hypothetical protein
VQIYDAVVAVDNDERIAYLIAAAALRTTGHWRGEYFHIRRDGVEFPVETSLSCLRAPDGTPVGRLQWSAISASASEQIDAQVLPLR